MKFLQMHPNQIAVMTTLATLLLASPDSRGQTAYWTNSAGGDWNVADNWDVDSTGFHAVPGVATNADIGTLAGGAVTYNSPMSAPSFATLTLGAGSSLDINAAGFNLDGQSAGAAPLTIGGTLNVNAAGVLNSLNGGTATINLGGIVNIAGNAFIAAVPGLVPLNVAAAGALNVNAGGVATIADGLATTVAGAVQITGGSLIVSNTSALSLLTGSTLTVDGGSLIGTNNVSGEFAFGQGTSSDANAGVAVTNNGGTIILDRLVRIKSRDTKFTMTGGTLDLQGGLAHDCSGNDSRQWFLINGGTANLHDVTINRASTSGGLRIQDGVVTTSSARIGIGIAASYSIMTGGFWTNAGALYVGDRNNAADSGSRRVFLRIDGGELVTDGADGIVINNQGESTTANLSNVGGELQMNGGTITAEGIQLNGPAVTANAMARLTITGGTTYLGSVGLVVNTNSAASLTASITLSGGTIGAKANWSSTANLPLTGPITFKAADKADAPFNIELSGILSGSGALYKAGAGTLTLGGANTYSGITYINNGTLALGAGGAVASPQIHLDAGTSFDVSAVSGGYVLPTGRTIAGFGTIVGPLNFAATATINPGSNTVTGTLTLNGSLNETGGAINHFDLSTNPSGPDNDLLIVNGDVNVSGANTMEIVGGGAPGSVHPLIQYTGNFNGSLSALTLSGASGILTNNTATKTIALIVESTVRNPTSVTWVGNASENDWDVLTHTNWLNGAVLDSFVTGDTVRFDSVGAANSNVNLVGNVAPAAVTVDAATDYSFGGAGSVSGTSGLTKTNSGTLTISTTNLYTGPTIIGGGTLVATMIADAGLSSSIGAAGTDPANLVFDGGALSYPGSSVGTTRGATFNPGGAGMLVPNAGSTLAVNGVVTGPGQLKKLGAGALALNSANSYAGGTVVSNGVLQIGNGFGAGYGDIALNDGTVLRVAGSYTMTNNLQFTGTVGVDLNDNSPSGDRHLVGEWSGNNVTILITNLSDLSRTFTIGGNGGMGSLSGILDLVDSSCRLRFNNGSGNPNTGSPAVHLKLGTGTVYLEPRNGNVTIDLGALEGGPLTVLRGRASGDSGTVTYAIGALNLSTVFEGNISNSPTAGNLTGVRKVGDGKLTLTGTCGYTGPTSVEGGTLQVDGALGNSFLTVAAGTLTGGGSIDGFVEVASGATFSPGTNASPMTINNTLQLDAGSFTVMELNPAAAANDSVLGLASVSYGGTLTVTNLGGSFAPDDTFTLFSSSGGYGGAFDSIELPPLGTGLAWDTSNLAIDGSIKVVSVVLPQITASASGGVLILSGTNGAPDATYQILSSTNLANPLSNWTSVETNVFDANGAFSFTNAVDPGVRQKFFILLAP